MSKLKEFFSDLGYYLSIGLQAFLFVCGGLILLGVTLGISIGVGWIPIFFLGHWAAWFSVPAGIVVFFAQILFWIDRKEL